MQIVGPKHTLTHPQTEWRLYDQVGPEGHVGENLNKTIVTEKNSERKKNNCDRKKCAKIFFRQ